MSRRVREEGAEPEDCAYCDRAWCPGGERCEVRQAEIDREEAEALLARAHRLATAGEVWPC
jgi:hypothetical protein